MPDVGQQPQIRRIVVDKCRPNLKKVKCTLESWQSCTANQTNTFIIICRHHGPLSSLLSLSSDYKWFIKSKDLTLHHKCMISHQHSVQGERRESKCDHLRRRIPVRWDPTACRCSGGSRSVGGTFFDRRSDRVRVQRPPPPRSPGRLCPPRLRHQPERRTSFAH